MTPDKEWSADGVIVPGEYSGSNTYGDYTINWRSDEQYIYIGMTARTNGWIAIALQPGSKMKEADMVFAFIQGNNVEIMDSYSSGNFGPHAPDSDLGGTDDILASGGKEDGEFTTIEFQRSLITGDNYDIAITSGANKVIWAYGESDNQTDKHSKRGYGEIVI